MKPIKRLCMIIGMISLIITASLLISSCSRDHTHSESSAASDTVNGMYDEYILTEEDLEELNEAFFKRNFLSDLDHMNMDEGEINIIKNSKYGKFAETIQIAMMRSTDPGGTFYFGKFSNSIVVVINSMIPCHNLYNIGDYVFEFYAETVLVCYDSTFYELDEAYEMSILTEDDINKLYQLCDTHYFKGRFDYENEKSH